MVAGVVNCLWLVLALTLIVICLYFSWPGEATTECPDGGRCGQLSMVGTGTNTYRYLFVFQLTWRSYDWMPWWRQAWLPVCGWCWSLHLPLSVCISADLEKLRLNTLMVAGVVNCLWLVLALTLIVICLYFSRLGEATTECLDGGRRGQLFVVGTGTNTYRYLFVFQLTWRSFDWMPWWLQAWSTVYGWYWH